jgi:rod shape-determining protein MreC
VHDKQVRRRRAVLGLLVALSLILLTAYFGESPSSPLHSVQRGIVQVFSPIQAGASKVLSPVRDVANWVSDTLHAKSQNGQLKNEVAQYKSEAAQYRAYYYRYKQLATEQHLVQEAGLSDKGLVGANVIERDPSLWYETIMVDRGSDDGVQLGDPVIGDGALVGDVTTLGPSYSVVTLLTDHSFAVGAQVENIAGDSGLLVPAVGSPNELLLQDLPTTATVSSSQRAPTLVVTSGFKDRNLTSLYPPGIPIGTVVPNPNPNELANQGQVQVTPAADLRHLASVQIMTKPHAGTSLQASLP